MSSKGNGQYAFRIDGHRVEARVVERTPWGGYTVTGVGAPRLALTDTPGQILA